MCKRVIGLAGDVVEIDENGNVYINGQLLEETYLTEKALGCCDIAFPCAVPPSAYFMMGDNRGISRGSRSEQVGAVSEEQVLGKLLLRVWPLGGFGSIACMAENRFLIPN